LRSAQGDCGGEQSQDGSGNAEQGGRQPVVYRHTAVRSLAVDTTVHADRVRVAVRDEWP
jgi:hypothetical protein